MTKKILLTVLFLANVGFAAADGPTIECRFGGLKADGAVGLDEIVSYTLTGESGIVGDFYPYSFDISVADNNLSVGIYLAESPINSVQIPVRNVMGLPLGASVFGLNTFFHEAVNGFVSLQFECRKVLW